MYVTLERQINNENRKETRFEQVYLFNKTTYINTNFDVN